MRIHIHLFLVATLFFFASTSISLAQETSPTVTLSPVEQEFVDSVKAKLSTPEPLIANDVENVTSDIPKNPIEGQGQHEVVAQIDNEPTRNISAQFMDKTSQTQFSKLAKKYYHTSEFVSSTLIYGAERMAKIQVLDVVGNPVDAVVVKKVINKDVTIKVYPPANIRPGKYTIVAKDKYGTVTRQDFMWGVLAINTNKSIYLPHETALISLAVLNEKGEMVCDADVSLMVENIEQEYKAQLKTSDGTITINPACRNHKYSNTADYETKLTLGARGVYTMTLHAVTKNGEYSITDKFEVRESVPFDVERITATRIYPHDRYIVQMKIKANDDFTGSIVESVPRDFTIFSSDKGKEFTHKELFDAYSFQSASDGASLALSKPFKGDFPLSLEFGSELETAEMKEQYHRFNLAGHDGVDYAMPEGTEIIAVDDGVVDLAGEGAYGTTVVIRHSWGKSYYGHLSELRVAKGDEIEGGSILGLSGQTGFVSGPHLHFGIKLKNNNVDNGYYGKIDPLLFVDDESSISQDAVQRITWDAVLKKGDELILAYEYDAPDISPQFYLLGPLQFIKSSSKNAQEKETLVNPFVLGASTDEDGRVIFEEVRRWQIAVDAISIQETVTGSMTTGNSFTLTSWTPGANELVLLAVAVRREDITVTASGNGLTFQQIADVDDADAQTGVTLFRAMGSSPSSGQITVTMTGNDRPAVGIATRFSGVDTSGSHGSGAIEASATDDGTPGTTDDNDMKVDVTTLTANAIAFGAGTHRTSTFTVPGGQSAVSTSPSSINVLAGSGGDATRGSTFYQSVSSPSTVTVGGNDDLSGSGQDWALIAVSIKPAVSAATLDQLMRHGNWFSGGTERSFSF